MSAATTGGYNGSRGPGFEELNLRLGYRFKFGGRQRLELAVDMFNVTNHANFDAVRWNTADPQFGEVLGMRPRRFRLDFDWLLGTG